MSKKSFYIFFGLIVVFSALFLLNSISQASAQETYNRSECHWGSFEEQRKCLDYFSPEGGLGGDPSRCHELPSIYRQKGCLEYFSIEELGLKDINLLSECDKIGDDKQNQCYRDFIVGGCKKNKEEDRQDECLIKFAELFERPDYCGLLLTWRKSYCYAKVNTALSLKKEDSRFCEKIEDSTRREICYFSLAEKTKNAIFCNKADNFAVSCHENSNASIFTPTKFNLTRLFSFLLTLGLGVFILIKSLLRVKRRSTYISIYLIINSFLFLDLGLLELHDYVRLPKGLLLPWNLPFLFIDSWLLLSVRLWPVHSWLVSFVLLVGILINSLIILLFSYLIKKIWQISNSKRRIFFMIMIMFLIIVLVVAGFLTPLFSQILST